MKGKLTFFLVSSLFWLASCVSVSELNQAALNGDLNKVKQLISEGAEINTKNSVFGETPLHDAALICDIDVAKYLISKGADVNAKDASGDTPLHDTIRTLPSPNATERNCISVARLLLSKGANVNAQNNEGETPLHYAVKEGSLKWVKFLVENGAITTIKDSKGKTPLDYAKDKEIATYLKAIQQAEGIFQEHRFARKEVFTLYNKSLGIAKELDANITSIIGKLKSPKNVKNTNYYERKLLNRFPCKSTEGKSCENIITHIYENLLQIRRLHHKYLEKEIELIHQLRQYDKKISHLLNIRCKRNPSYADITFKTIFCDPQGSIEICRNSLVKGYNSLIKLKREREYAIRNLEKNCSIHNIVKIMLATKDRYLKDCMIAKIKEIIDKTGGDYTKLKLSGKEREVLEPYIYEDAIRKNTLTSLKAFKELYPNSPRISEVNLKIRNLKHKEILRKLIYSYNKWDEVKWIGSIDKYGWPNGKGKFHLELSKSSYWAGKGLSLITEVHTQVKHHKILKGTVDSQITVYQYHYIFFVPVSKSVLFRASTHRKFNGLRQMNDAIRSTVLYLLAEAEEEITGNSPSFTGRCQELYSLCKYNCSSKDFACSQYCKEAGLMCNEGEFTDALVHACYGICDNSNDKCINDCIAKLRTKIGN